MLERESDRLKGALLVLLPDYKQHLIPLEELRAKIAKELPKDALPASEGYHPDASPGAREIPGLRITCLNYFIWSGSHDLFLPGHLSLSTEIFPRDAGDSGDGCPPKRLGQNRFALSFWATLEFYMVCDIKSKQGVTPATITGTKANFINDLTGALFLLHDVTHDRIREATAYPAKRSTAYPLQTACI